MSSDLAGLPGNLAPFFAVQAIWSWGFCPRAIWHSDAPRRCVREPEAARQLTASRTISCCVRLSDMQDGWARNARVQDRPDRTE